MTLFCAFSHSVVSDSLLSHGLYVACKTPHGIIQDNPMRSLAGYILEWVVISSSRGSSPLAIQPHLLHLLHWQEDSVSLSHLGSHLTLLIPPKKIVTWNKQPLISQNKQLLATMISQTLPSWWHNERGLKELWFWKTMVIWVKAFL